MTRGDSATVTAAVTLDQTVPRDKVLHRPATDVGEEPGILVSCRIQARLSVSQYQFEVNEADWVVRSLLTSNTARWSWYVTPKVGGTHTLVLELRPILTLRETESTTENVSPEASNVQQYETTVHVQVPWNERPQEMMSRLAATFKVAEGLVRAMTLLVLALVALGAALGIRGIRRKRASQ